MHSEREKKAKTAIGVFFSQISVFAIFFGNFFVDEVSQVFNVHWIGQHLVEVALPLKFLDPNEFSFSDEPLQF